jgi:hypothetical protein
MSLNVPKVFDKFIEVRDYSDEHIEKFMAYLCRQNWLDVAYADTADQKYDCFFVYFPCTYFPMKRKKIWANRVSKVNLSPQIKTKRRELINLHKDKEVRFLPLRHPRREAYKRVKFDYTKSLQA